jgi:hypothetical protein
MDKEPLNEDQDVANEQAFVARAWSEIPDGGQLAEPLAEHHPTVAEPVPPIPSAIANEEISFIKERPDGVKVTTLGSILEEGSHGPTPLAPTGPGF